MITVDKLMTKNLVQIQAGMSAIEAAKLMSSHKVGSVFVKQDNRIVGSSRSRISFARSSEQNVFPIMSLSKRS